MTQPVSVDVLSRPAGAATRMWWPVALLAIVAPTLIAAHDPPSITFYNQALAVLGWGLFAATLARLRPLQANDRERHAFMGLAGVMLINALLAAAGALFGHLAGGLGMMGSGLCLAALVVLWAGWHAGHSEQRDAVFAVFAGAMAFAGVLGMLLAGIQVFHPDWADGHFIAEPTMVGRAVGNLRQPNHFSTLLVWACCGLAWLGARRRVPVAWAATGMTLFIGGVVLTASRTGMIGMLFLTAWGALDRRLPRAIRWTLIAAPLIYGVFWGGMWLWSHLDSNIAFAADARLHDKSDISSSRFKIWSNVLTLVAQHPWTGVGYGEFNVAWSLTPFPTRPIAFFDHTHNLPLQWAVEFGLPLTAVMLVVLGWAAWRTIQGALPAGEGGSSAAGACAVIVVMAGFHSLLEYPLWYSYFLLPTAFAWGMGLGSSAVAGASRQPSSSMAGHRRASTGPGLLIAGVFMALAAIWCAVDYQAAANIYAPRPGAGPLAERIEFGQRMPWFGYQADYADATGGDDETPSKPPAAFRRTLHNLVDARLMIAYARSLAEHGQVDKARYVVQRLKEFRNPMGDAFLEVCRTPLEPGEEAPFQCAPPSRLYSWRELLPD